MEVLFAWKLYRARSRLYQSRLLQANTRLKAFAEIYTIHSFALLESNLKTMKSASGKRHPGSALLFNRNFSVKNCPKVCHNFAIFSEMLLTFAKCLLILTIFCGNVPECNLGRWG